MTEREISIDGTTKMVCVKRAIIAGKPKAK